MPVALNKYLQKSDKINDIEVLSAHYDQAIKELGFNCYAFIFFPPKISAEKSIPCCPVFNIPKEVLDLYISNELYQVGPIFQEAKTTGNPILWSDFFTTEKSYEKNSKLKEYIRLLAVHGYNDGITVPVFGVRNSFGHFSFSCKEDKISLSDPNITILRHVCMDMLYQYTRIKELDDFFDKPLTPREKEVLSWVLKGKSNNVIAEIMGISEHTVNTYIKRSSKKLGASSKWSAGISAVLTGLLQY